MRIDALNEQGRAVVSLPLEIRVRPSVAPARLHTWLEDVTQEDGGPLAEVGAGADVVVRGTFQDEVGRETVLPEGRTVRDFSVRAFGQNCRMDPSNDGGMCATVPVPCKTNLGKHWWKVTIHVTLV
jgi:hypothetical protein